MSKRHLTVRGVRIALDTDNYVSLNQIIADSSDEPSEVVRNWIKKMGTIKFLWAWEEVHNPDFAGTDLAQFLFRVTDNRYSLSPSKWIRETNAVGIYTKMGRGGGTYAHEEIALEFCSWYDPYFKVYLMNEFQRLKTEEAARLEASSKWHIRKITDYVDSARELLDSIPHQDPQRDRTGGKLPG